MDATGGLVVGVGTFAACCVFIRALSDRASLADAFRELRIYAGIFVVITMIFVLVGHWLSSKGLPPEQTATALAIEKHIVWLRSISAPLLKLSTSIQLSILVLIAVIALSGSAVASKTIARSFSAYRKVARLAFAVLFALSSFSFFQAKLADDGENIVATLKTKSDGFAELNRKAAESIEAAVLSKVADELAQDADFRAIYDAITRASNDYDDWRRQNEAVLRLLPPDLGGRLLPPGLGGGPTSQPDGPDKPGSGPGRGGAAAKQMASEIEGARSAFNSNLDILKSRLKSVAQQASPTPDKATVVSMRQSYRLPPTVDMSPASAAQLTKAALALTTTATAASSEAGPGREVHAVVRKSLEAAYSATMAPQLQQALNLAGDSISDELLKTALDPILLGPLRELVVQTSEKLIARIFGGERLETVIDDFIAQAPSRLKVLQQAVSARISLLKTKALQANERLTAKISTYRESINPFLVEHSRTLVNEISVARRALPSHLDSGSLGIALSTTIDKLVTQLDSIEQAHSRTESFSNLLSIIKRMSSAPVVAFSELQQLETATLGSRSLAQAHATAALEVLREDRQTRWGEVRARVSDAIRTKALKLTPNQILGWDRIWRKWTREEQSVARSLALQTREVSGRSSRFDVAFTKLLKQDGEFAAIWGFAAKSFIASSAKEEFYRRQIASYDTIDKVKRRELDFVINWSVLQPAIEQRRAHDLADAIRQWKAGRLYDLIDLKTVEEVIRGRGMIPAFGLEHYLVSSNTGTLQDAEQVMKLDRFDKTVTEYCN
jgi:hypothetical protein